ncbi:hypothetical protein RUM43_014899, partial [Polyplax serrata]
AKRKKMKESKSKGIGEMLVKKQKSFEGKWRKLGKRFRRIKVHQRAWGLGDKEAGRLKKGGGVQPLKRRAGNEGWRRDEMKGRGEVSRQLQTATVVSGVSNVPPLRLAHVVTFFLFFRFRFAVVRQT